MKKNALYKDIFRNLKKFKGRFFSIVAIIALGVAFFSGLKIAPEAMKTTADKYYDDYNLMDIRVVSSLGLTDEDLREIEKLDGVEEAKATYFIDALIEEGDSENVFRVHNYHDEDQINGFKLVDGRFPKNAKECLVEQGAEEEVKFPIGSEISLESGRDEDLEEDLKNTDFTVVGVVQTPYYLSFEKGNSSIGNGRVSGFIAIPEENFQMEAYTDIYLTVEDSKKYNSYSDEYFEKIDPLVEELEEIAPVREKARYDSIISDAESQLAEAENTKNELYLNLEQLELALTNPEISEEEKAGLMAQEEQIKEGIEEVESNIAIGRTNLDEARKGLELAGVKLEESSREIEEAQLRIENERSKLLEGERLGKNELEDARNQLEEGKIELRQGKNELEDAKITLQEGKDEYEENKKEAYDELDKAAIKIEDAKREVRKIEKASWHVLDRNSHYSYVDYGGAADRIDALAKVFPLFFAMVAALVCLTSMARMVDEQRGIIGTLKALGYGNWDIALKYIIYALAASIVGAAIGLIVGYTLFPIIIFNAYGIMYVLPSVELVFNPKLTIIISMVSIILITATAYIAAMSSLRENAASLMRPKAPKIGKRIFLEKVPFIWKRFNFSQKVTLRNIFRYKRRFFMTVFGVAGCTALMLAGFGIKDSIRTIHDRQFSEVLKYDVSITVDSEDIKEIDDDRISDQTIIQNEASSIRKGKEEKDLSIIVPKNTEEIDDYIGFGDRESKEKFEFPEDGAVISEQVSRALKIRVGDEITLINNDDQETTVKIKEVTENYTFNYVYLSPEYYEEVFDKKPEYNTILGKTDNLSKELENELSRDLLKIGRISGVEFNSLMAEEFNDIIFSLNYVVIMMIVFAGALAFVVLYNLTNINISERLREIATIKVLGFYDNEVSAYIYRENIILTIFGVGFGSLIGIYLHRYIMTTVEMDNIMFGLKLNSLSYAYSIALTFIFSILVNFSMHYKLKNIKMVESLKSVE